MKTLERTMWIVVAMLVLAGQGATSKAEPMDAGFTYQGRLSDAVGPAEGLYDFQFKLFDAATGGQEVADAIEMPAVEVIDGYFTTELDFISGGSTTAEPGPEPMGLDYDHIYGLSYDKIYGGGEGRWLEIAVRPSGGPRVTGSVQALGVEAVASAPYTTLLPRQKITPVPYALYALNGAGGAAGDPWVVTGNDMYSGVPGNVGIGTTTPTSPLDIAGAANLNKGKTGIALTVNGKEALWSNDTYFSWGYGGSANFFGDNVGIGPGVTEPAERLDVSWSGGVNARIGRYDYLGSCHSSATFVLGNNLRARTDGVNGIVVGQPHDSYGYRAVIMSLDGIQFYGSTGAVKAGDPLDPATERMRITNDGKVGIGTTSPTAKLQVAGTTLVSNGGIETIFGTAGSPGYRFMGSGVDTGMFAPAANVLALSTNSAERMRIDSSGNVGIGTTSPKARLDVAREDIILRGAVAVGGDTTPFDASAGSVIVIAGGGGTVNHIFSYDYSVPASSAPRTLVLQNPGGSVAIGTTNPGTYRLAVNGSAAKIGGGSWSSISDIRLKQIRGSYERGLSEVLRLNPVTFSYTADNGLKLPSDRQFVGLVAQEVRETIPEAVEENSDGYLMVNNDPILWAMANAIKELKQENDQLRKRLEVLEAAQAQSRSLSQRIEALEQMVQRSTVVAKEVLP